MEVRSLLTKSYVTLAEKDADMQDFRVETFLTVCQTMSYTAAARQLHITQPAVSQHIAFLEKEYGVKLFEYRNRKLLLTKAGYVLRDALSTRAHDDALLHRKVKAIEGSKRQDLKVGMTLTAGKYLAARPLALYLSEHPEVRITVRSGDTATLMTLLDAGEVDCAFVEGVFDGNAYASDTFCTERLVCVCAPDHALGGKRVQIEDLLGLQLFVREEGSGTRAVLEHALAERNLSLDAFAEVSEVGSLDIIKVLVAEGLGISFLYEAAVHRKVVENTLGLIPLKDKPIEHGVSFVRLKDSAFEHEFATLFHELKSIGQS